MDECWNKGKAFRKWRVMLILLILLGFGSFLRLWNLGVPSFWVDEVNGLYAAKSWNEVGNFALPSGYHYNRAPIYTYATGLLFRLFGISESSTRLTSVIFGILSILLAYQLGKKVFNERAGLLTAFFMAFSHFEVGWSRTARMYTLLQFLTLVFIFLFIKGFESDYEKDRLLERTQGKFVLLKIRAFLHRWGVAPLWLIVGFIVFYIAYFHVHYLAIFLFGGLFLYLVTMTLSTFVSGEDSNRVLNKYSLVVLITIVISVIFWFTYPSSKQEMSYFLSLTPPWAGGASSAQNRFFLFEFLIGMERFPLAAFFFVGSVQIISRKHKLGWIPLWIFLCPVFFLSFVFTHRVPTYLLYVYPFFLMIAAFGFINILENEALIMNRDRLRRRRWLKRGVVCLFLSIFIFSPWLRITLHIPFFEDGMTNLAVTPSEWREASKIVTQQRQEGELIITSLPQVALYYGIHSDYSLNWSGLAQSKKEKFFNESGRSIDVYAGVVCIESLDELKEVINDNPRGWIVLSDYHLHHLNYTPEDVRDFILKHFPEPVKTKNGTVLVYHWPDHQGEDSEL